MTVPRLGQCRRAAAAAVTTDEVECIEEGGTEPTIALLRRLAAALDAGTPEAWGKSPS